MRGFKSIFVSSKYKINRFLIQEKYFQTANAVDTLPLTSHDTQTTLQCVGCKSNARDDRQGHTLFLGFAGEMITESKYMNIFLE